MIAKNQLKEGAAFLVTGSDTGVGKTVFTGLLGRYLMDLGIGLRLTKPFCSGGKGDIDFLASCGKLDKAEVNFWYDEESISPAALELRSGEKIDFEGCVKWLINAEELVKKEEGQGGVFLIEGVGGLLAPLAKGKTMASLGQVLGVQLIVIAPNRVGVINHVLMTMETAVRHNLSVSAVVLIGQEMPDSSATDNAELIRMCLPKISNFKGVFEFPWLGKGADNTSLISDNTKKAEKALKKIAGAIIQPFSFENLKNL